MINAGYVTIQNVIRNNKYVLRIPNGEVRESFKALTAHYLHVGSNQLEALAKEAIAQSENLQYAHGLNGEIIYIGLAHYQKEAKVEYRIVSQGIFSRA